MLRLLACVALLASAYARPAKRQSTPKLVNDISLISQNWGWIRPYSDNYADYFGVQDVGLPDGCGIEQVHQLQRHGARYPTGQDFGYIQALYDALSYAGTPNYTGPLSFMSTFQPDLTKSGLLVESGAAQLFSAGTQFWNLYGRLLYNATLGQNYYNASYANGTARSPIVFRTTTQPRIRQSALNFIHGFFGYQNDAWNISSLYKLVELYEGGTENNTLASYDNCANDNLDQPGSSGDDMLVEYVNYFLNDTTARLQSYISGGNLTLNNQAVMGMMLSCAYEYSFSSSNGGFCSLFTQEEWNAVGYGLSLTYNYDYSFLQPTGRAQGIGYLQELISRLTKTYPTSGVNGVNLTYDDNPSTFPLNQKQYVDLSHDDILISVMTAMGIEYFNTGPMPFEYPSPVSSFNVSFMTPFAARLTTEVYGCNDASPTPKTNAEPAYTINGNGYNKATATNKFIRIRLNQGILPLSSIPGGYCTRPDGLCSMSNFLTSQANATQLAQYEWSCFGNATQVIANFNGDGASVPPSS